ncbi:hypothetical protein [Halorussus salinus]|uniref:hypothetical protein n=1 Tax=Halorussus salinus TaxID=1364935 RepID=UPI00138F66CE|nr:hypothetical protein [Halorussus salinus]
MSSSDATTETRDAGSNGFAGLLGSLADEAGPRLARQAESGNLAAASGVVSLVAAGRAFLNGERKRGVVQAVAGLFWVGVALAQRRTDESGGADTATGPGESDLSAVASSSPDVGEAVEPGERDADHATGEEVVDTTDADIEETDTAPEVQRDTDTGDVDQRDVTDSTDAADAVEETDAEDAAESQSDADDESASGDVDTDDSAAATADDADEANAAEGDD